MNTTDTTGARGQQERHGFRALSVSGLAVVIGIAAFTLFVQVVADLPAMEGPLSIPWWFIAALSAVTDLFLIEFHLRRNSYTTSLAQVPLVVGLVFCSPGALLAGRLLGTGAVLVLHGRQYGRKLVFNVASEAFTTSLAIILFHRVIGDASPMSGAGLLAALTSMLLVDALSPVLVVAAITVHEGRSNWGALPRLVGLDMLAGAASTSLALIGVIVVWHEPQAAWLFPVVATIAYLAYRGYASLAQRYARLELLYSFTRAMGNSLQPEALVRTMLTEARELLHAEIAELILFGDPEVRATLGRDDVVRTERRVEGWGGSVRPWWQPAAYGDAVCLSRPVRDDDLRSQLELAGLKDAVAAPLRWGSDIIGVLIVANRWGEVSTFGADDLRLFETLANHATVSLENGRLVQRLRQEADEKEHQALHDALTGLPNRRLFQRDIDEAIARAEADERHTAVILMDLDRFKEVNDTLGHHTGDLLLCEVGHRLQRTLQGRGTIARLGGDEFGVLLPEVTGPVEAEEHAATILEALAHPFTLDEITLEVDASMGLALSPDHGTDAAALLQRADVAMYVAKGSHSGVQVYQPADDRYTRRRLSLVSELRQALSEGQLVVYYQPKVRLPDHGVTGVEALVRWIHPEHGFLPPDEFIPLAEQTGLVRPLTSFVLQASLRQCAEWRAAGIEVGVAVNLSVRSLVDSSLPDEVAHYLEESGLPAEVLTLEITESSLMVDPQRSAAVLERLHDQGITLSVDDFGTGYSTLTYLKRLPVGELKIDRSFVNSMASDENDAAIVESTIVLAHSLGLHVVAEGVENAEVLGNLARLGCDEVQGYFFSRPLPAKELNAWLIDNLASDTSLLSAG